MADEVNCDVTGDLQVTYHSVLTVKVISAGVVLSGCQKAGEGWLGVLGTLAGVHLDSGDSLGIARGSFPSSHHDSVLKFNSTRMAENEGKNTNIYSD